MNSPRRPGLRDVAALAGVSTATVSYVLSGKRPFAPDTTERVRDAIAQLDYRPNRSAAALRMGQARAITLIIPDVTNPFYTEIVVGVEEAAAKKGMEVLLRNANLDPERERRYLHDALGSDVASVLLAPFTPQCLERVSEELTRPSTPPLVLIDEALPGPAAACVSADNEHGGAIVAERFAARGVKRAGVVGAPSGMPTSITRIDAFRRRCAQLGIEVPERAVARAQKRTGDAVAQATAIVEGVEDLDALFAGDDLLAIALVRTLRERGVAVPQDVAVCGFDDIPWSELVTPALTTVRQPAREMGRTAFDLGIQASRKRGENGPRREVILPVTLVERASA